MAYGLGVVGTIHYAHFTIFQTDGITPWSGQAGGVTSALVRDGGATGEAVAIAEIGVTGRYYASYTPLSQGEYDLRLTCPDNRVIGETCQVYDRDIGDLARPIDIVGDLVAFNGADIAAILNDTGVTIPGLIAGLNDITVADIFNHVVEGALDFDEFLRIMFAVLAGHSGGGATAQNWFRDLANAKDRVRYTVDANGNRTVLITLDGS
jgi:hypothetical protein